MSRPIQALIDLSALEYNLSVVRRHAPSSRVMAVIKADAYGHGLLRAAEALARADGFAMLELDAAVRLREAGYRQTILLLEGFFDISELALDRAIPFKHRSPSPRAARHAIGIQAPRQAGCIFEAQYRHEPAGIHA